MFCLILRWPIHDQSFHHIETSQLICSANQLIGFYMMGALVDNRLTGCKDKVNLNFHIELVHLA